MTTLGSLLTRSETLACLHRHLNAAGECRRAAAQAAATGQVVGFYGPDGHKRSARAYLADARARRLSLKV